MKIHQIILLFISFIFCKTSFAQQHNFSNYSVTEGLAQSQVSAIWEDQKGYLWLGTKGGGLCQFDGVKFSTFTTQNGLSSNYINVLFEDSKGILWIATANGLHQLKNSVITNLDTVFGRSLIVNDLLEDENGVIWLATDEGLFYVDNQVLKKFDAGEVIPADAPVFTLFKEENHILWIGGKRGLYQLKNRQVNEIRLSNGESINDVRGIIATKDGVYWIAAYNQGIFLINLTTRQGLPNNNVQSIVADSWGNIWLGTSGGGLSKYSGQQFEHFTTSEGLKGSYIQAIENDSKGRLWVATSGNGVQIYEAGKFSNKFGLFLRIVA